jgi:hypothetical protein
VTGSSQIQTRRNNVSRSLPAADRDSLLEARSYIHSFGGEFGARHPESGIAVTFVGAYDYQVRSHVQGWRVGINLTIMFPPLRRPNLPE